MNKQHLRPCIGGWLLIAGGALPVAQTFIRIMSYMFRGVSSFYLIHIFLSRAVPHLLLGIPAILAGIFLSMKKRDVPVAISCASSIVMCLLYTPIERLLQRFFLDLRFLYLSPLDHILYCLPYILLALVALIAASPKNPLKKLWWIPAAIAGLAEIFSLIRSISMLIQNFHVRNLMNTMLTFLFGLVAVAGFFFAGQWLADPLRKKPIYRPAPQVPQGNYYQQPQYQQPVQPQPAATNSVVQELERAKALLDSGAITQEEYDALKKRLLN